MSPVGKLWLNSPNWLVCFLGHLLTPQFMLGEGWLQWYMARCSANVFILLCHFMLSCDFLEWLRPSVTAQCWDYRSRSVEPRQSLFVVKAQPAGWWMWGRGWILAVIAGLSVRGKDGHPSSPACSQAPRTGCGENSWRWRHNQELCVSGCVFSTPFLQARLVPDLWLWHILAVGCVVLGSYSPTLCKITVKRQIWPGDFSAKDKWAKAETSAKWCQYRLIERKIPQNDKILSFLSLHFPTVFL